MGYRSNVAITIYGNSEKLNAVRKYAEIKFINLPAAIRDAVMDLYYYSEKDSSNKVWGDDSRYFFYATSVKWYSSYPVVDYIESIFQYANEICDDTDDFAGEYVRVGEEDNDIDVRMFGDCDGHIRVDRSIRFEVD